MIDSLSELYSGGETMATNKTLIVNRVWDEGVVVCCLVVVLVAVQVAVEVAVGRLVSISLIVVIVNNMGCTQSPCDST